MHVTETGEDIEEYLPSVSERLMGKVTYKFKLVCNIAPTVIPFCNEWDPESNAKVDAGITAALM